MKKLFIGLMIATMLILSSCDFGELTGGWNNNDEDDNATLIELIEAEILAETDVDAVIEEDIDIDIPTSFSKALPGPNGNGNGRNKRRIRLKVKQGIDSVDVQRSIEYTADDTALVTLTKTLFGTMVINQRDTAIVDTPEVWEKSYEYTTTSYMQFVQVECADSCTNDSTGTDTTELRWKLVAKSIEAGETAGILNTIENVTLDSDNDSTMLVFDDTEALYEVVRGRQNRGSYRGRPGVQTTEAYVAIDGSDDVNVLGSGGRYFALLDDGEGLDLTADDNIFSGSLRKGNGHSRLRVRMITTVTFIDKDAPVEIATWFLPVR
ncbi:MAG: hypothetical protein DRP93_02205 [Candidatus Neomarinimicrobiota bacterium]|nr:MAG: hypothetical protein DRP93_02205 [Candidatus Neomarinimicrobiota bacterium]